MNNAKAFMLSKISPSTKKFIKGVARQTLGRVPPSPSRLTGTLAKQGGKPVRDVRFRPWPNPHSQNARH